ncbi:MAG: TRAP transporter small permease [Rhodospirillales bacterium]|jgi:TRAP-type C4-dicarboxylate transport system permease small subunit|nr:TRAP transporter small permease [Rhodospirillales bacterium]
MTSDKTSQVGVRLVRPLAIAGGYGFLVLSLLVAFEVIARKFFAYSLQGIDEIGGYVMAGAVALGISYTLVHRAHTRIDMFIDRLPMALRPAFHAFAMVALAAFGAFMAWRATTTLIDSVAYQSVASTPLQTPLWIPQLVWNVGLIFFAVLATGLAVNAVFLAVRDPKAVLTLYGPRSVREEVEDEVAVFDASRDHETGDAR